jgi:hypothetical protein
MLLYRCDILLGLCIPGVDDTECAVKSLAFIEDVFLTFCLLTLGLSVIYSFVFFFLIVVVYFFIKDYLSSGLLGTGETLPLLM